MLKPIPIKADARKLPYDIAVYYEIRNICRNRMEKYPNKPCTTCRYRDPRKGHERWCMFADCPSDWGFTELDNNITN